jgi:8-oxo-dGTP diphosphatase
MDRRRFKVIPAVYLILRRGDEVLLQRRSGTRFGDGQYAFVQGHVDGNETAAAALVREAREEVGITVAPDALRCVHVMHRKSEVGEWFDLFFTADRWQGQPKICEPDTCDDLTWRRLDDLPPNLMPYLRRVLDHCRAGVTYSAWGWDHES